MKDKPILVYLLFTLFLGLKLAGEISWSWIWVFAPLWAYALLTLTAGLVVGFRRGVKSRDRQKELTEARLRSVHTRKQPAVKAENRPDVH